MADCCTNCNGQAQGFLGQDVQNILDVLSPSLEVGGLDVNYLWADSFYEGFTKFLFETEAVETPSGNVFNMYKIKGTLPNFQKVKVADGCKVVWFEGAVEDFSATTVGALTAGATSVVVNDVIGLGGISAGSEIYGYNAAGQRVTGIVASVDSATNTITLSGAGLTGDLEDAACLFRGSYRRAKDCVTPISNEYQLNRKQQKYESNFRRVEVSLDLNLCDVNLHRYVEDLGIESSIAFIREQWYAQLKGAMDQMVDAIRWDKNIEGDTTTPGETMGLFPALAKVHAAGKRTFIDYSACCASATDECEANRKLIDTFLSVIEHLKKSGAYKSGNMQVVVNDKQLDALRRLHNEFMDYDEMLRIHTPSMVDAIDMGQRVPVLEYLNTRIEFIHEPSWDVIPYPIHAFIPEGAYGFYQKMFSSISTDGDAIRAVESTNRMISNGVPALRFIDRTAHETNGVDDCFKFLAFMEFAIVWMYTDKCAYLVGTNFTPCNSTEGCYSCDVNTVTEPFGLIA